MLQTFKNHQLYFEYAFASLFKIIITMPQFNNKRDINELCDIYFRKMATSNLEFSGKVCEDCYKLVEFLMTEEEISYTTSTFDDYRHAYHYMALITHLRRMENKHQLVSMAPDMHYNICNILSYNQLYGY
jgi:hypothetical protein